MAALHNPLIRLDAILSNRIHDRQTTLLTLLTLYLSTQATLYLLPYVSTRFKLLPKDRQMQIAVTIPMCVLRCAVGLLVAYFEYSPHYLSPSGTKTFEALDLQFGLCYILCIGYLFELMCRPGPLELQLHHVLCTLCAGYYLMRKDAFGALDEVEQQTMIYFFQIPCLIIIYGIPPVDFASDAIRILYHCYSPSILTLGLFKVFIEIAWAGRILQWFMMARFVMSIGGSLWATSGAVGCVLGMALVAFFLSMEVNELFHFKRLTAKYKARLHGDKAAQGKF